MKGVAAILIATSTAPNTLSRERETPHITASERSQPIKKSFDEDHGIYRDRRSGGWLADPESPSGLAANAFISPRKF
jgi:hypothetical protein